MGKKYDKLNKAHTAEGTLKNYKTLLWTSYNWTQSHSPDNINELLKVTIYCRVSAVSRLF